ncbi:phage minor head protein [Sporosarcina sp. Marseille-Q4943]|uniref:phage minor head protein n=1 Tax=Sporosarcina sp. Marseille-Q4943 TaxID=2942204 RepID=UPI00208DB478|nr:phage minor head protein [Sporosarcina sp. Marseille-Q4943]
MSKVDKLLENINAFIQKAEEDAEDITAILPDDIPELEKIPSLVEEFEKITAKLLRRQRKLFLDGMKGFIAKDDEMTLEALLNYFQSDLFATDDFAAMLSEEAAAFLTLSISELATVIMESIDKDIAFEVLSKRTTDWIESWSKELGEIMQLNTHKAIETELLEVIQNGESIQQAELRIKDLPQFDRKRARATARTEILAASSQANWESFMQSPAVEGKKWKHSGSKKSKPRPTHVAMDGTVVGVDELFLVDGEFGMYPRDTTFSAKNRVNCGCVIGPVVDQDIIGLSKEEKEEIRRQVLEELNS